MIRTFFLILITGLMIGFSSIGLAQESDKAIYGKFFPDGKGKELTVDLCSTCHSLEKTVFERRDAKAWRDNVNDMISRGAQIFPDEAEEIIKYLSEYLKLGIPVPQMPKK